MRISLAFFAAACLFAPLASAQEAPVKKLHVLVKPARPFVFEENGEVKGYAIDLWRRIAQEGRFDFDFTVTNTVPELLDAIQQGKADVGVGALSITSQRQDTLDFTQGFYKSGLRILVPPGGNGSIFSALKQVFTGEVFSVIGVLLGALLVNAHLLWWLERRRNPESFPEKYPHGVAESLWWSVCTIMTGGCENKAPIGIPGRLLAVVWMLGCIALTSFITANLSATLTTDRLSSDIKSIKDLATQPAGSAGTVQGSSTAAFLQQMNLTPTFFPTVEAACDALVAGKVKAVVYDEPLLRYYMSTHADARLQLVGDLRERQSYGFALQDGSPYRKTINRIMLKLSEDGFDEELDKKWFPSTEE